MRRGLRGSRRRPAAKRRAGPAQAVLPGACYGGAQSSRTAPAAPQLSRIERLAPQPGRQGYFSMSVDRRDRAAWRVERADLDQRSNRQGLPSHRRVVLDEAPVGVEDPVGETRHLRLPIESTLVVDVDELFSGQRGADDARAITNSRRSRFARHENEKGTRQPGRRDALDQHPRDPVQARALVCRDVSVVDGDGLSPNNFLRSKGVTGHDAVLKDVDTVLLWTVDIGAGLQLPGEPLNEFHLKTSLSSPRGIASTGLRACTPEGSRRSRSGLGAARSGRVGRRADDSVQRVTGRLGIAARPPDVSAKRLGPGIQNLVAMGSHLDLVTRCLSGIIKPQKVTSLFDEVENRLVA